MPLKGSSKSTKSATTKSTKPSKQAAASSKGTSQRSSGSARIAKTGLDQPTAIKKRTKLPEELETLSLIDGKEKKKVTKKAKALPRIGARQPSVESPALKSSKESKESTPAVTKSKQVDQNDEGNCQKADTQQPNNGKGLDLKPPIMIKELAALVNVKPFKIIHDLMEMNIFANINQSLELPVVKKLCEGYGFYLIEEKPQQPEQPLEKPEQLDPTESFDQQKSSAKKKTALSKKKGAPSNLAGKEEQLLPRPPIITFMGHVDHGKTSLLDAIRKSKVASGEAGGITQRIGAYMIEKDTHRMTFIDTPGHAAFTAMRARGAQVTDIVVLVVAANDGLMPQTLEALDHARAANVAIIVAINKIDIPGVKLDRIKQQLQEHGLAPEEWGGDTICCEVSATTGQGIDNLLEMMLLQAEMLELQAQHCGQAQAYVIEAEFEAGRGPTATLIVSKGTLKVGDAILCGNYWGKVKQLINDLGKPIKEALPATPVKIFGLSGLPNAGDEVIVMESEKKARMTSEQRLEELRHEKLSAPQRVTLENLFNSLEGDRKKKLEIVLKADMQGSLEAIKSTFEDIPQNKIELNITHAGVGPITESDVLLATASNAVIIGFGVKLENAAANSARREGIQVKLFSIIYELIDQVREAMSGMLEPELRETTIGHAEVKQVFKLSRGLVGGSQVNNGRISKTARARVLRKGQPIYDGGISTLRRFTEDVKEVKAGLECGIRLGDFSEYEIGDIIECYQLEKIPQDL